MEYTRYVVLWCIGHGYCTIKGVKHGRTEALLRSTFCSQFVRNCDIQKQPSKCVLKKKVI